jgi:uncharacterized Rmd1/YagE family protein
MNSFRYPLLRNTLGQRAKQSLARLHASSDTNAFRRQNPFSSNAALRQENELKATGEVAARNISKQKRKPGGNNSLRKVAIQAQQSRATPTRTQDVIKVKELNNTVRAISVADQFDMDAVSRILRSHGFTIDPDDTGFDSDHVIHTRGSNNGDIFVFPSGSVVGWSLPQDVVSDLATKTLLPAAVVPHMDQMEVEDLEYEEDTKRDFSNIKGDVITLGTKTDSHEDSKCAAMNICGKIRANSPFL